MESISWTFLFLMGIVLIGAMVTAGVVIQVWAASSGSQRQAHRRAHARRKGHEPEPDRSSAGPIVVGCVVLGGLLGVALAGAIAVYLFGFGKGGRSLLLVLAPAVGLATVVGLTLLVVAAVRRGTSSRSSPTREREMDSRDQAIAPPPRSASPPPARSRKKDSLFFPVGLVLWFVMGIVFWSAADIDINHGPPQWHHVLFIGLYFLLLVVIVVITLFGFDRDSREVVRKQQEAQGPAPRRPVQPPESRKGPGRSLLLPGCLSLVLIGAALVGAYIYLGLPSASESADASAPSGRQPEHIFQFLASLAGLVAFAIVFYQVIRYLDGRSSGSRGVPESTSGVEPPYTRVAPPARPRPCPKCGTLIDSAAPQGLCPRCLLQGVMPNQERLSPTLAFIEAYVAPPVEEVQRQFPHLEIIRLVGQGGMGAVYLARQPALDRLVAIKLLRPHDDPTFTERFVREAKAMARLSHPNIVTVYESGEAGGLPYLVMEYVDGFTLRDAMRERKLSPAEALAIVPQICDALDYAHSQGVVHRDIKPENILLSAECGTRNAELKDFSHSALLAPRSALVKIADFGLAKVADPAAISLTGTQQAMGTPHYMAPEQWEKPGTVDHRADIYALGVVLYELLTGELPLGRFEPPSRKVRLDLRIDDVVLRALAKEPGSRYQHASDVRIALSAIQSGTEIPGWVRTPTFAEYRSRGRFLGWPLVHIVRGRNPATGRGKVARGWIAIGDSAAVGGIAIAGGWSAGVFAIAGGGAFGVLALAGGVTVAGVALAGGWAAGLLAAAAGGVAASLGIAVAGGYAAAWQFAIAGGSAVARHVLSSQRQDPGFAEDLADWLNGW